MENALTQISDEENQLGKPLSRKDALRVLTSEKPDDDALATVDELAAGIIITSRESQETLEELYPVEWPPGITDRRKLRSILAAKLTAHGLSISAIADFCGVSAQVISTLRGELWFQQLCTIERVKIVDTVQDSLKLLIPTAVEALSAKLLEGDMGAIKMVLENEGIGAKKTAAEAAAAQSPVQIGQFNIRNVVSKETEEAIVEDLLRRNDSSPSTIDADFKEVS